MRIVRENNTLLFLIRNEMIKNQRRQFSDLFIDDFHILFVDVRFCKSSFFCIID